MGIICLFHFIFLSSSFALSHETKLLQLNSSKAAGLSSDGVKNGNASVGLAFKPQLTPQDTPTQRGGITWRMLLLFLNLAWLHLNVKTPIYTNILYNQWFSEQALSTCHSSNRWGSFRPFSRHFLHNSYHNPTLSLLFRILNTFLPISIAYRNSILLKSILESSRIFLTLQNLYWYVKIHLAIQVITICFFNLESGQTSASSDHHR